LSYAQPTERGCRLIFITRFRAPLATTWLLNITLSGALSFFQYVSNNMLAPQQQTLNDRHHRHWSARNVYASVEIVFQRQRQRLR
jgi:hypothetical protein